jgi:hypothetical protein
VLSPDFSDVVFVSFGHSPDWDLARKRLYRSIHKNFPQAKTFFVDQKWLHEKPFFYEHRDFFLNNPKGFGLWLWKPFLIAESFKKYLDVRYIIYLDMGCEININSSSRQRLMKYLEMAEKNGALAFELDLKEVDWTSKNTLNHFQSMNSSDKQIVASALFFSNNPKCRGFVNEWLSAMLLDNYSLTIGAGLESELEYDANINHRHDQSILSLIWHKTNFAVIPDETYWGPNWTSGLNFPIWVSRNRELVSVRSNSFSKNCSRLLRKLRILMLSASLIRK